jgi:branched-chain amino acid transport system permease protein
MAAASISRRGRLPAFTRSRWFSPGLAVAVLAFGAIFPLLRPPADSFLDSTVTALAYVVMALGLNIVVGYAGLLDLGYVAFYAIGAYVMGWLGSSFINAANFHFLTQASVAAVPGVHVNFILIVIAGAIVTAVAGALIGLPTLRLRGDYIAIVTLAFGEIIYRFALNGDQVKIFGQPLTAGRQGITPVDAPNLFGTLFGPLNLRPWYWFVFVLLLVVLFVNLRVRNSRLGRAWIAIREDEVAAASMGVPLVKTKLMAYATGASFGGAAGVFLAAYQNTVNADQFQFSFSIFVLGMIILGGLASIWGVALGALALSYTNTYLIPDVFNGLPGAVGLNFDLTEFSFGIFGLILVVMMLLRPQGLLPEARRQAELTEGIAEEKQIEEQEPVVEARA